MIAEDVEFTVEETGEVQKVSMKDEVPMGQLIIKKTDAEDQTPLANVEFELKNKETEEVVGKLTTDKDGVATSELLPIATYEDGKAVGRLLMYYRKRNRWKDMKSIRKPMKSHLVM